MSSKPLRIGLLGASQIAPTAVVRPALQMEGVQIRAVAARSEERAQEFAQSWRIPQAYGSYEALLQDSEVDAVYIGLPNHVHREWTLRALEAGKHVLCEKPISLNHFEAEEILSAAKKSQNYVMEGFHWQHHALARRALEIVHSGELGRLQFAQASFCVPNIKFWDMRYRWKLGGGSLMDLGCYSVHLLRKCFGFEPTVTAAYARTLRENVDRAMQATLDFQGVPARMHCSMFSSTLFRLSAQFVGEKGELHLLNPYLPQPWNRLTWKKSDGTKVSETLGGESTYLGQLRAFAAVIAKGAPYPLPEDSVSNMKVIDAIYEAAGLSPRGMPFQTFAVESNRSPA